MSKKKKHKKNGRKKALPIEYIILATVLIQLIQAIIELIICLIE